MLFSSLLFLFRFLPALLLVYFAAVGLGRWKEKARGARNIVLLLFSLLFYAWGEPKYVILMLISTLTDYCCGQLIGCARRRGDRALARAGLIISMIVNLGLLGVFKYADFVIGTLNTLTPLTLGLLHLTLPIGISFYTFQTMSYTIDVYRGEVEPQKNILSFATFVTSFPQLIAGPVVRYRTVAAELENRRENLGDFAEGVRRFVIGLGKKVLIANQVGAVWDEISAMSAGSLTALTAWTGIFAFTLQIYFDFSGYSDMAIGLGRMLGFHFLENFDHPYESKSITEFWRRWHISMGTWFREYVYIPLGGNRRGLAIQIRNLLIVWFLTGLWHGASWNFVVWGLYYGFILVLEKLVLKRVLDRLPAWVRHIYAIALIMIGWTIFSYVDMADGMGYVRALFGLAGTKAADSTALYLLRSNLVIFIAAALGSTGLVGRLRRRLEESGRTAPVTVCTWILVAAVLLLCVAFLVDSSYNPFLYFRF